MIAKVELAYKIIFNRSDIVSPRIELNLETSQEVDPRVDLTSDLASDLNDEPSSCGSNLPSNEEIEEAIRNARNDALVKAATFGINFSFEDIMTCECPDIIIKAEDLEEENALEEEEDNMDPSMDLDMDIESGQEIQNQDESVSKVNEAKSQTPAKTTPGSISGKFVHVLQPDGSSKKMHVSTLIWSMTKSTKKPSADRTRRVQQAVDTQDAKPPSKKFKKSDPSPQPSTSSTIPGSSEIYSFNDSLSISDWTLFRIEIQSEARNNFIYLLGVVIGFRFVEYEKNEKTHNLKKRVTKYKYVNASTKNEEKSSNKKLQVLCLWYTWDEEGILTRSLDSDKMTVHMNNYVATMKNPKMEKNVSNNVVYVLSPEQLNALKNISK